MIHPTAVIDKRAELHEDVDIGPYTIIDADVRIDRGCHIGSHVVIRGPTEIGQDNRIYQFASIGDDPQDKKYAGEYTRLVIGHRNVIREYATIHRGTIQDRALTQIGDDNLFMAYTHVAHDCLIGNHVIMANAASLGGHIEIQDWAILGGFSLVHQFCRLGVHCFTAMGSVITKDVPPYVLVAGHPAKPYGINIEGLQRRGFAMEQIQMLQRAYRILYRSGLRLQDAIQTLYSLSDADSDVAVLAQFAQQSVRGLLRE
jgi:UDP-N-acetylglucosamine acyltransferase